jgi:hypothetical protein
MVDADGLLGSKYFASKPFGNQPPGFPVGLAPRILVMVFRMHTYSFYCGLGGGGGLGDGAKM